MPVSPILFLHIGWAREYRGAKDDLPQGQFGFFKRSEETPGETLNFRPYRGRCFGYAAAHAIDLTRLGGGAGAAHVDGVLVVWTATAPDKSGRFVVGWYKNARVFAELTQRRAGELAWVVCEARASDCHLVPIDERTFFVPSMKKRWPGVRNAFFAEGNLSQADRRTLLAYVDGEPSIGFAAGGGEAPKSAGGIGRNADPETRAKVEKAAVDTIWAYYKSRGWTMSSVQEQRCGWDLEATQGRRKLLIEVKGRDASGAVEVTPNEYEAMRSTALRMSYRLAIVHNARSPSAKARIFAYDPGKDQWAADSGEVLTLSDKTGAIATY